ncbi:MAG: hypothetical protein AUK47_00315 [Deltaproteobacteria bacterium CG2_30_63_29]|nr:MAG: hypothetical protein AUK47_00315 [Deltaproteobacteria bacterium CG2_30_63_29]PIW02429.1 MAG: hypothetical protein COW42_01775 [Deltaproteobacteria bacterium CG17_big_fil_post_rev_8_21_14_2_50_63_7]PJB42859.1 MAG: hypothetical protein CO108_11055 [Deltaproteobacteria bacterium CG_4_9_14_3_um_filter_63_12]
MNDGLVQRKKSVETTRKFIEPLLKSGGLDDIRILQTAHSKLELQSLTTIGLESERISLCEQLQAAAAEARREVRNRVINELHSLFNESDVRLEVLSETPPTLSIPPFTVELDVPQGLARILYARSVVTEVALAAEAIFEARTQAMGWIRERAVESSAFFDKLRVAYQMLLVEFGGQVGDRIDLVDLFAPLTLLQVERSNWRKMNFSKLADFPRYLLSYQLSRLRRDGLLEKSGWRLELGTATGGSTKNKANVLYVPHSTNDGQYYLSLRFTEK